MQYKARKHYETYYQKIAEAEKDPAVVKGENADGKTYILEKDKLAMVVGKNNEYIIFHQHDGNWSRLRPNGELELTYSDGAWVRVMPDGERIAVKASGNTNIAYHQGDVSEGHHYLAENPRSPRPSGRFRERPPKTCKAEEAWHGCGHEVKSLERLGSGAHPYPMRTDRFISAGVLSGRGRGTR